MISTSCLCLINDDADLDEFVEDGEKPKDSCSGGTVAWAHSSPDVSKFSQIQICDWFIGYAQEKAFPTCKGFGNKLKALIARAAEKGVMSVPLLWNLLLFLQQSTRLRRNRVRL